MTHPLVRITDAHFHREVRTLPNGLRLAIEAGRDSSMVGIHAWLLAGKAREQAGARGIAHVVEHLLVEGAQKSFPGGLTQHLERLGGEFNMWVALKCVVVFLIVPRDQLDEGLRIASTVLFRPKLTEELVKAELEVIRRELVGKDEASLPPIEATKTALLSVFGHRLAPETGGLPDFGLAEIQEFHRTLYAPNNAVIAVAGGVEPDEVERAALRHFGDLPRRDVPPLYSTQVEDRPLVVVPGHMRGGCGLAIGWAVPELPSDIEAGLTVVHLGSTDPGDTSGRRSVMLAEDLAFQAAPYLYFERSPAIVSFTYFCPEDSLEPIVRSVTAQVEELRREPLPASIVERVRWSIALETARENENPQNRARRVGCFELLKSGLHTLSQGSRAIAEVDGPTARDVAAKVLTPERRLVLVVAPPDRVEAIQARLAPLAADLARAAHGATVARVEPPGQSTRPFSSGGILVADRNPESDLAVVIVGFREAGTAYERPSAAGAATVLAGGLGLAEGLPPPGGRISPWVDALGLGLKIECVADLLPEWLDRLASHFGSPSDEIVEYGIASAAATLDASLQDPETRALELGLTGLLGRHPFARTSAAARRALEALTPDAVRRHAAERMTADRLYVAAAGGIDPASLASAFERLVPRFGLGERARPLKLPAVTRPSLPTVLAADVQRPDFHHVVDWRAVPMDHADRAAVMIVDCALSWYGGRLFRRLREERQLIYHLITTERFFPSLGLYGLTCGTAAEGAAETLREFGAIIRSVAKDGLDADELERCRSAVIGSAIIEATPADARAEALSADLTAGVEPGSTERVRQSLAQVDLATVNRVARQVLRNDRMALAVVGPDARRRRQELLKALLGSSSGARATGRRRPGARK